MGQFLWPDWKPLPQDSPLPPPSPDPEQAIADNTRAEEALNQFIAARQNVLFEAPDAFYRTQGSDAIHAAPAVTQSLDQVRSKLLDGLANDSQRNKLASVLDAQMRLTRDGMARHVAEQSLAWQRKTAQDRIGLLTKEAAYHHNDNELVDALGHAASNAARAHARVGNTPLDPAAEDAAAATARSGVLTSAIQARLDHGDVQGANALLTRVNDQLDPAHAGPLQSQFETGGDAAPIGPQLAQTKPLSQQKVSDHRPAISENEMDAALLMLRDMRRKERAPLWEQMIRARLPDASPGTGIQAPLSDDWRADVDKINPTYGGFVEKSARKYGIPPELLARLLAKESNFDIHAGAYALNGRYVPKSDKVAVGIPQMLPTAAKSVGVTRDQLANGTAEFQIDAGAKYLAQQFAQAKNWPIAVAAYQSGYGTVADWLNGSGPNFETEEQRREGYVQWDDKSKDRKGKKVPSQWRLIQPDPSNPKVATQITTDVSNWSKLKKYLPYMFLGDPNRYDSGNADAPKGR
jgi:hypothetical protein